MARFSISQGSSSVGLAGAREDRPLNTDQHIFWALVAVLLAAMAFGGGGSKYGMANFIVQLAALISLSFFRAPFFEFWKGSPTALKAMVLLSILLPLAFLIPLPPSVWSGLPGRELVLQSYDLIGVSGWSAASVNAGRTVLAVTALIVPVTILTIGWSLSLERLIMLGWVIVALGLANFLIGIPQVLSNSEVGVIYPENPMPGVLFGSFANRNSAGLFLVCALTLAAILPPPSRFASNASAIRIGICVLLLVAIILTRSRTALVLAVLPVALGLLRAFISHRQATVSARVPRRAGKVTLLVAAAVVTATVAATAVYTPGRIADVAERFSSEREDARAYIWEDALYSAERFWPVGSGTGTFDDVFQVDESLENLTQKRAGRAHNDYIEVAIEAGIPGLTLIAGWLLLAAWLSWRARHAGDRWIAWAGSTILLAIALQSITDYPLRNLTMLAIGGIAVLMLTRFGAKPAPRQEILT